MTKSASVAMAVYNGERFIRPQIDSVLEQLETDDELVISYDKSVDKTFNIIQEYEQRDPRVKVVENSIPGITSNFENAIYSCLNDIIFICDQDDIWLPGKRDIVINAFEEAGVDLVIHNGYNIDRDGQRISKDFFTMYSAGSGFVRNFIKSRYSGCCMAFTKESSSWILPFPRAVDCYDRWIASICELHGKVGFLEDMLLEHRMHEENATPKSPRGAFVIASSRYHLAKSLLERQGNLQ